LASKKHLPVRIPKLAFFLSQPLTLGEKAGGTGKDKTPIVLLEETVQNQTPLYEIFMTLS
jgi:hypothetical protein